MNNFDVGLTVCVSVLLDRDYGSFQLNLAGPISSSLPGGCSRPDFSPSQLGLPPHLFNEQNTELQRQMEPNDLMEGQTISEKDEIEEECGMPDAEAALLVSRLLHLTDDKALVLNNVLSNLHEDPILVLRRNSNWMQRGGAPAETILDAIAMHNIRGHQYRRDSADGCRRGSAGAGIGSRGPASPDPSAASDARRCGAGCRA